MSIPATELPSGVNATLLSACSMNRGGPIGCDVAGSQRRTDPSWKPTATRSPSPRKAAQMAGVEAAINLASTAPVMASRSLTVPSFPSGEEGTTVGTEPSGRLVSHRPADRPPADRVPELGVVVVHREQGLPIRPEFDSPDRFRAGQELTDGIAGFGIPESNAGLAFILGQTDREHLAVGAVGQTEHDLALRQRAADFLAGGGVPEPHQAAEIARGQDLAVRLERQGRDVVGDAAAAGIASGPCSCPRLSPRPSLTGQGLLPVAKNRPSGLRASPRMTQPG